MMSYLYQITITLLVLCSHNLFSATRQYPEQAQSNYASEEYEPIRVRKPGDPLRILFVTSSFPRFDQQFILNQICGIIDEGHEVYIAATRLPKENIMPEIAERYKLLDKTIFCGSKNPFKLLQRNRLGPIRAVTIPPIDTFDVICSQFGDYGAKVIQFKKEFGVKPTRAKIVTCFRGRDTSEAIKTNPHLYDDLKIEGDLNLPVCDFFRDRLVDDLGFPPEKTKVLYSTINCNNFAFRKRTLKKGTAFGLISVSRLIEKKGIEYTIRAVAEVAKTDPKIHYTIVGDGPIREQLQSLINSLNMQRHISMIGAQPNEVVPKLLYKSHLFVLSSITAQDGDQEGIANALKEAMATGMPVLTTKTAGNAELVEDGITGFLVEEKDVQALASKIRYLMRSPNTITQMGRNGRLVVEQRFHIPRVIERFIMLLEEVCAQN